MLLQFFFLIADAGVEENRGGSQHQSSKRVRVHLTGEGG